MLRTLLENTYSLLKQGGKLIGLNPNMNLDLPKFMEMHKGGVVNRTNFSTDIKRYPFEEGDEIVFYKDVGKERIKSSYFYFHESTYK
jgi:hypothetical protein